jgi:hypothetical protein
MELPQKNGKFAGYVVHNNGIYIIFYATPKEAESKGMKCTSLVRLYLKTRT